MLCGDLYLGSLGNCLTCISFFLFYRIDLLRRHLCPLPERNGHWPLVGRAGCPILCVQRGWVRNYHDFSQGRSDSVSTVYLSLSAWFSPCSHMLLAPPSATTQYRLQLNSRRFLYGSGQEILDGCRRHGHVLPHQKG